MTIQQNVSLKDHSTMRLGGTAAYLCEVTDRADVKEAYEWAKAQNLPIITIGSGSNIFWQDSGFPGLVIVNKITGFEISNEDEHSAYISVGAGENWDAVVKRTVEHNLSGIAELSLIPGTAGATPIQNVGAYGREISEVLITIEVFDMQTGQMRNMMAHEAAFGYRTSRFKTIDKGNFIITGITMLLHKDTPTPPFYDAVKRYFDEHQITIYSAQAVRDAVIAIRQAKLPDPAQVPNNGSFFKNPLITESQLQVLLNDVPDLQYWHMKDSVKLSAAWLIEKAGFKDFQDPETGMATWPTQPLVLINQTATSTSQLLQFKSKIVTAVQEKFGIILEQEPELLP